MLQRSLSLIVAIIALTACNDSATPSPTASASYSWGLPVPLQGDSTNRADAPAVVSMPNGQALAAWTYNAATFGNNVYLPGEIHTSVFIPGSGWSAPALLEAGDSPRVAANARGTAIAAWSKSSAVRVSLYSPATGWSTPDTLSAGDTLQGVPLVAIDATGNAIVVWEEGDLSYASIYASRLTAGGAWSAPQELGTYTDGYADASGLAMNAKGDAIAVWSHYTGSDYSVHAARFAPGGGWQATTDLATGLGAEGEPGVTIDGDGNAIAVWAQATSTGNGLRARRFDAGTGTWSAATALQSDDTRSNTEPMLGTDAGGNVFVVWTYWGNSRSQIQGRVYAPGTGWGSVTAIDTGIAADSTRPRLAVSANGTALVAWQSSDGLLIDQYASQYRPGSGWTAPRRITADYGPNGGIDAALAIDANGKGTLLTLYISYSVTFRYALEALRFE